MIDGGKSKTDAIIIDETGRRLAESSGPGLEMIGSPNGPALVGASLRETLGGFGAEPMVFHTVAFDLNGVQAPSPLATLAVDALRELTNSIRYIVASDAVMTYVGALGIGPGVVVAAGTGSAILAMSHGGEIHRVDASGPLLGDRGSGYDIGRRGLENAFRFGDGLPGSAVLYERMLRRFGDLDETMHAVYGDINPSKVIASFSRDVAQAAIAGDETASAIWRDAGKELARSVIAAAEKTSLVDAPFAVACAGGVFTAGALIQSPFEHELHRLAPHARVQPARGGALDGGALLALQASPVLTEVSTWVSCVENSRT